MLLAGQRQRPGRALPPSERNCSRGRRARSRIRTAFRRQPGAGRGRSRPRRPRPPPGSRGPQCPAAAATSCLLDRRGPRAKDEDPRGVAQDLPEKRAAHVPGQLQERLAARTPGSQQQSWPRQEPRRTSLGPQRRRAAERLEERVPRWSRRSQPARTVPSPPAAPASPAAPANRRPRGSAGTGRGSAPLCACPQPGPAETVPPGRALRAAVISDCPAPARRGCVGRGFSVAVRRAPDRGPSEPMRSPLLRTL